MLLVKRVAWILMAKDAKVNTSMSAGVRVGLPFFLPMQFWLPACLSEVRAMKFWANRYIDKHLLSYTIVVKMPIILKFLVGLHNPQVLEFLL